MTETNINRTSTGPHLARELAIAEGQKVNDLLDKQAQAEFRLRPLVPADLPVPGTAVQTAEVVYDIPDHVGEKVRFQGKVINLRTATELNTVFAGPKTAEGQRAGQVGYAGHSSLGTAADADVDREIIGSVLSNPGIQAELAKQGYELDKVTLDKFLDFRDQVIRAFKHFGLDTRQFFN